MKQNRTTRENETKNLKLGIVTVLGALLVTALAFGSQTAARTGHSASTKVDMQLREGNKRVAQLMLKYLEEKNIPKWHELWAEGAVQEMPFAPKGFPVRLEGKDALHNQYKDLPNNFKSMRFPIQRLSTLEDPSWVMIEYKGVIELKSGGTYNNSYIGMLQIRNGKIVLFREYFDPIILQESFGTNLQKNFNAEGASK